MYDTLEHNTSSFEQDTKIVDAWLEHSMACLREELDKMQAEEFVEKFDALVQLYRSKLREVLLKHFPASPNADPVPPKK